MWLFKQHEKLNSSDVLATWQPLKNLPVAYGCHTRGRLLQGCLSPQDIEPWLCQLALPDSMALVFRIPADLQVFSAGCQTFQVTPRVAHTTKSRSLKVLDFRVSGISRDPKWSYNRAL